MSEGVGVNFHDLIKDDTAFAKFSAMYNSSTGNYKEWRAKREFVTSAITQNGSILDIGCGGGLLLRSLQEWSEHVLIPYGIDISAPYINAAKQLFSDIPEHFTVLHSDEADTLKDHHLPAQYDFVYWNRSRYAPSDSRDEVLFNTVAAMARVRLIIAVYAPNIHDKGTNEWREERIRLEQDIDSFYEAPTKPTGKFVNPTGYNQAICWFDSPQ